MLIERLFHRIEIGRIEVMNFKIHSFISVLVACAVLNLPQVAADFSSDRSIHQQEALRGGSNQGDYYVFGDGGFVQDRNIRSITFQTLIKPLELHVNKTICQYTPIVVVRGRSFTVCIMRGISRGDDYVGATLTGSVTQDVVSKLPWKVQFNIKFISKHPSVSQEGTYEYEFYWHQISWVKCRGHEEIIPFRELTDPEFGYMEREYARIECTVTVKDN